MTKQCGMHSGLRRSVRNVLAFGIALALGVSDLAQASAHIVTNTNDSGSGSLRQAILDGYADTSTPVLIDASLVSGTITLTTGSILIYHTMTILGPGPDQLTISGNNASTIFYTGSGNFVPYMESITISGLRLTKGRNNAAKHAASAINNACGNLTLLDVAVDSNSANGLGYGAVASVGGCKQSQLALTTPELILSHVTITNNQAGDFGSLSVHGVNVLIEDSVISGNTGSIGTGIYSAISGVYVIDSQISNNHSSNHGGGIACRYGGLAIVGSTISGNVAAAGGGIYMAGLVGQGTVFIENTLVSDNVANAGGGGGLLNRDGAIQIRNSTFSGNIASQAGGGMSIDSSSTATFNNVTIAGNTSATSGGGMYASGTGTVTVESGTIAGNSATTGGGIFSIANTSTLHNTAIANNHATTIDPDLAGSFAANFTFVRSPGDATLAGGNNILTGIDPVLGSLGDYGGVTPTILPNTGSPLIDSGDPAGEAGVTTDQRGSTRVVGSHIDIGAVERQANEDVIFIDGLNGY
jgi:hypothetical protein